MPERAFWSARGAAWPTDRGGIATLCSAFTSAASVIARRRPRLGRRDVPSAATGQRRELVGARAVRPSNLVSNQSTQRSSPGSLGRSSVQSNREPGRFCHSCRASTAIGTLRPQRPFRLLHSSSAEKFPERRRSLVLRAGRVRSRVRPSGRTAPRRARSARAALSIWSEPSSRSGSVSRRVFVSTSSSESHRNDGPVRGERPSMKCSSISPS